MLKRALTAVTTLVAAFAASPAAHAQGCVLCYTSAAASGPAGMHALLVGMAVLLFPALSLFLAVGGLIFYRARVASLSSEAPPA